MKPSYEELEQRLIESERYGRQTDITIDNLEMQLAQMAAENAGLKSAHPQPFGPEMMKALDAYMKHQDEVPEAGMLDAFFILRDSIRVDTTATDSFLAEVRAQGVDLICDYHKSRCEALHDVDRNGSHRHGAALCDAIDIAAQIRKGVQS
ncbi:hypothetical protein [Enterobacter ludwigii]|uniref:hypothetical protein n=1 Tax=Enterobacter ludwigii TaxID=299767 RepID=UPI00206A348F|nr:hypothetical protein [Enterobacter ludwigii]DAQ32972.1 MAG TPA: hypothetical protein [Caudoviricetes sp.]